MLERVPEVQIVAEANDGREAIRLIEGHQPDVALIDIVMPGLNGLEVAARVAKDFPNVRIIILSMYESEEYVWRALRSGAAGYLLKGASATDLEHAVKAVGRGETYLSPPITEQVIRDYVQRVGDEENIFERLTPRQREVLQLIAEGHTTKAIARILEISVKTVETHRAQLMERLGIYDIAGLVRYAVRIKLVKLEE